MLAASKDTLVAGLKQNALMLRHKELEYYVERYSNITTQASTSAATALTTALSTAALTITATPTTLSSRTPPSSPPPPSPPPRSPPPPSLPPPSPAQASILAGFAFDSLVELEIPNNVYESRAAVVSVYYIAASSTMALSLYTVCVSSFATVYGHRLALQGPTGSVDRAVAVS